MVGQGERLWVIPPGLCAGTEPGRVHLGYWKQHALPNVCPKDYWGLDETARRTLKRIRRRPRIITTFRQQAELSF